MKISIEAETPEEIQRCKPVQFVGLQSILVVGIVHNELKVEQVSHSFNGNIKLLMDQLPELTFQLTKARLQAEATQQQRIQVPNMRFIGGDGKQIG